MTIANLCVALGVTKGSFYHHFEGKEDFALQAIDLYMEGVHAALDAAFTDDGHTPAEQIRRFFEMVSEGYKGDGYFCLLYTSPSPPDP